MLLEKQLKKLIAMGNLENKELVKDHVEVQEEQEKPYQIQREKHGWFKKGVSANPAGKPKGVLTKRTERLKAMMDDALSDGWKKYLKVLNSLEGKEYAEEYRALMEFRIGKMERVNAMQVNIESKEREPQTIKIGDQVLTIN